MCSLVFKNAQHQRTALNLRLGEFHQASSHKTKSGEDVYISPIHNDLVHNEIMFTPFVKFLSINPAMIAL